MAKKKSPPVEKEEVDEELSSALDSPYDEYPIQDEDGSV